MVYYCALHGSYQCSCQLAGQLHDHFAQSEAYKNAHQAQYQDLVKAYYNEMGRGMVSGRDSVSPIPPEPKRKPEPKTKGNKLLLLME